MGGQSGRLTTLIGILYVNRSMSWLSNGPTSCPSPACGGLAPTSVMVPTDERPKPTKIALIPQVACMGGLGGCVNGRTRAICGPTTHAPTLGKPRPLARQPGATDRNLPNVANPTRAAPTCPTATTPRWLGQPLRNAGHFLATDTLTNCAARVLPKDAARP
jgi:hypothetical protein